MLLIILIIGSQFTVLCYILDNLHKDSFCFNTGPLWNKGQCSLILQNSELRSEVDRYELLFAGLHFYVSCTKLCSRHFNK